MANEVHLNIKPPNDMTREFASLVGRCYQENPSKEDLKELRRYLDESPDLYRQVFDISKVLRSTMIDGFIAQDSARQAIETNMKVICHQLGYNQSPMIEKLLIDNVVNCWLRLQWVEYQLASFMGKSGVRFAEIEYWEKRLSASQRRYLRACETLARVRKITRATMQINIAEEGSQQVNIAGDLVNKKEK